jgi:hypothetical protein
LGLKNNYYSHVNQSSEIAAVVFKGGGMYKQNEFLSFHPVEISGGYHSLFVYSDIVYLSYIGDTCTQILRVKFLVKQKKKNQSLLIYRPGTYCVTNRDPYQSIELIEYYKS